MDIGLTGGIATGKSTVSKLFKEFGMKVIDVDKISKEVSNEQKVIDKIEREFGKKAIKNGGLDRKYIREIVFNDKEKLKKLNGIMHPEIMAKLRKIQKENEEEILIVDIPLLFEVGYEKEVDKVIVVTCSKEEQIRRLIERDKIKREEAEKIINSQMDLKTKEKNADIVINNSESLEELKNKVEELNIAKFR